LFFGCSVRISKRKTKRILANCELAQRILLEEVEPELDCTILVFFQVVDVVELAGSVLELVAASAEGDDAECVMEERVQVVELQLAH